MYKRQEYHIGELLEDIHYRLRKQVAKALYHTNEKSSREEDAQRRAEEIVKAFLKRIPALREVLATEDVYKRQTELWGRMWKV